MIHATFRRQLTQQKKMRNNRTNKAVEITLQSTPSDTERHIFICTNHFILIISTEGNSGHTLSTFSAHSESEITQRRCRKHGEKKQTLRKLASLGAHSTSLNVLPVSFPIMKKSPILEDQAWRRTPIAKQLFRSPSCFSHSDFSASTTQVDIFVVWFIANTCLVAFQLLTLCQTPQVPGFT